jgi:hypothetical protein
MVQFCTLSSNAASSSESNSAPVTVPLEAKPRSAQTFSATSGLSPVAILTSMPSAASNASESRAAALGSSAKTRKPTSVRLDSSSVVMVDNSGAGLLATATTRRPPANSAASVGPAQADTATHLAITCSGAPLTTSSRSPSVSTSADAARRVWSNGDVATSCSSPATSSRARGDAHSAASNAFADPPPVAGSIPVAKRPNRRTPSLGCPSGSMASTSVMRPSVNVPVLSVISTSISPRSSMHTSRLTRTLSLASRRAPVARLVLTTAGNSWGVMPTAIAKANRIESMMGRCNSRLVMRMRAVSVSATQSSR